MKLNYEVNSWSDFKPWSGAVSRYEAMTTKQIDQVLDMLGELYPEGMSECELNDIFWFEEDWIAGLLGFDNFEELEKYNNDVNSVD